jgi:lysophospholipase L1-like esterase
VSAEAPIDTVAVDEKPQATVFASIGDSYAAGTGAGESRDCGRSDANWVGRLAEMYGADHVNLACAGARLLEAIDQTESLDSTVTHVGISILGNDLGFFEVVASCARGVCEDAIDKARARLPELRPLLEKLLVKASEGRSVIVLGYPRIFGGPCEFPLSPKDGQLLNEAIDTVNEFLSEVTSAVEDGGRPIRFVRSPDFEGHAVCDADSWVLGFDNPFMLHPNEQGHQMMAVEALRNL